MVYAHVILFAAVLAAMSLLAAYSSFGSIRKGGWNGRSLVIAMTAYGISFCCIAGLYGALYQNPFVQEFAVTTAGAVLFVGLITYIFT